MVELNVQSYFGNKDMGNKLGESNGFKRIGVKNHKRSRHTFPPFIPWKGKPLSHMRPPPGNGPTYGLEVHKDFRRHGTGIVMPFLEKIVVPKGVLTNPPFPTYTRYSGSNCAVDQIAGATRAVTYSKTISSIKTPGFKTLKRRNLPFNPYTLSYTAEYITQGTFFQRLNSWPCISGLKGYIANSLVLTPPFAYPVVTHNIENVAIAKARAKAKGMHVNLAQTFGERRQTVNMLTTSVNRIVTGAMAIRNGNLKHAWNVFGGKPTKHKMQPDKIPPSPKNLANHWLEYQYGWKPLLQDIYGSAETLANLYYGQKPERVTAYPLEEDILILNRNLGTVYGAVDSRDAWTTYCDTRSVSRSKVVLEFYIDNPLRGSLASLGITNPLALAWEMFPYSFVVDWLFPLGNFLDTLDAVEHLTFKRGMQYTVTRRIDTTYWKRTSVAPANAGVSSAELTGNTRIRKKVDKKRVVFTTFPMPAFPTFSPQLGKERIISGISLLTQLFSRGKTSVR